MMRLYDGKADFGWISIALHWLGAILVLALLFIGNSIRAPDAGMQTGMLRLHTTVALVFYALLWLRVIWRFKVRHPPPCQSRDPSPIGWASGSTTSFSSPWPAMLVSGPVMAWSGNCRCASGT